MAAVPKAVSELGGVHKQQVVLYSSALGVQVPEGTPCYLAVVRALHEIMALPFAVKLPFDGTRPLLAPSEESAFMESYGMQPLPILSGTESLEKGGVREHLTPNLSFLRLLTMLHEIGPLTIPVVFSNSVGDRDETTHSMLAVGYSLKKTELYVRDPLSPPNTLLALNLTDSSVRVLKFDGHCFIEITPGSGLNGATWALSSFFNFMTSQAVSLPSALLDAFKEYTEEFAYHCLAVANAEAQFPTEFPGLPPLGGSEKTLAFARASLSREKAEAEAGAGSGPVAPE